MGPQHASIDESVLLEIAGRWLRALTEGSGEVVALADREGRLQYLSVSGAVQQMLGYSAREIAARRAGELVHPKDLQRVVDAFHEVSATVGHRLTVNYRLRHQQGQWVHVQSTAVNRMDDGVVASIVVHTRRLPGPGVETVVAATTAAGVAPDRGSDHAPTSESVPLSVGRGRMPAGSAGRESFLRAVDEAIAFTASPSSAGFGVLVVEFDRAKVLLGNYGQAWLDKLMEQAGRRLASVLGPGDAYCALDAGQYAVLLQGAGDKQRSEALANRVQQALVRRYDIDGETIALAVIAGIATSERRYTQAEHVLRDAALAATRARAPGRKGRAIFQTKMRIEDTRYMALVSALHGALQGGQFRVYYQPVISLATRTLVGFEALVRWQHPERGLLLPAEFIRAAEETGLIAPMDRWVMREAARQMAQWNAMFAPSTPLHVSVNLSAGQVGDETEEHVDRVLRDSGLAPHQLRLEVTESAVLENPEAMLARMGRFKQVGVKLCLDDFGTGYASFSHLCELPYDTLKIDQSFIARMADGTGSAEIVNAIIVLAHNLRMDVVAEGVETTGQAAQLRAMLCESAQGFFFSRPLDPEAAGALISANPQW